MILEKLDDYIHYYKNIIPNTSFLINEIEETNEFCSEYTNISKWKEWTASNDTSLVYGQGKDGVFSPRKLIDENDFRIFQVSSIINYAIKYGIVNYCSLKKIQEPWLPDFFQIKKYVPGADMGPHIDSNDPTDIKHPIVSGVLYLNDNYEGGEIEFPNQNISIKPSPGSLIIFPSTSPYLHHPKKIINGNKYMVPLFWFRNGEFK